MKGLDLLVLLAHDFGFLIAVIVLGLQNKGIIWKKLQSVLHIL